MAIIKQIFKDWIGCVPNQAQCNALIKRYGTADEFARFVIDSKEDNKGKDRDKRQHNRRTSGTDRGSHKGSTDSHRVTDKQTAVNCKESRNRQQQQQRAEVQVSADGQR